MLVDILGEDIGDTFTLLPPFEDSTIEVVFMEVAGENIDRLILLQERWYDTIQVQPVVEYQDGLFRFQHETTMKYVGQRHCLLRLKALAVLAGRLAKMFGTVAAEVREGGEIHQFGYLGERQAFVTQIVF